jgi:hypothetical protein
MAHRLDDGRGMYFLEPLHKVSLLATRLTSSTKTYPTPKTRWTPESPLSTKVGVTPSCEVEIVNHANGHDVTRSREGSDLLQEIDLVPDVEKCEWLVQKQITA